MPKGQNDFHHTNVDQTVPFEPKDTIVERDPIVQTLPENNLTIKDIVEHLKHEYKRYGKELLQKLSMFPNDFKFDKNGLISIDDNTIPGNIGKKCKSLHSLKNFPFTGSSVFEVLPITFYSIGQKNVAGLQSWLNLLKKHGLMEYIKNPDLIARYTKIEEKITIWYFLGEVA